MGGKGDFPSRSRPEIAGIRFPTSGLGDPIALIYGRARVAPVVIWHGNFWLMVMSAPGYDWTTPLFGGMGEQNTELRWYWASIAAGIGEGPIRGIFRIYKREERKLVREWDEVWPSGKITPVNWPDMYIFPGLADPPERWVEGYELYFTSRRTDDPLTSRQPFPAPPPDEGFHWPYFAYFGRGAWPLFDDAALPLFEMDVVGLMPHPHFWREEFRKEEHPGYPDSAIIYNLPEGSNPADIIQDFLTHPVHGAGFDPAKIDIPSLDHLRLYTDTAGFTLGISMQTQKPAAEWLMRILEDCNCTVFWSDGKLKFLPLGEEAIERVWRKHHIGVIIDSFSGEYVERSDESNQPPGPEDREYSWVPSFLTKTPEGDYVLRAEYELTEDDLRAGDDGEAITFARERLADVVNSVGIKYKDRLEGWEPETAEVQDLGAIQMVGKRPADVYDSIGITDWRTANLLGGIRLSRSLAARPLATFKLDNRFSLLEPGDFVLLTHPRYAGVNKLPVWIDQIKDQDGELAFSGPIVELGFAKPWVAHSRQPPRRENPRLHDPPGTVRHVRVLEPTAELSEGKIEIWIAGRGEQDNWAGAEVHVSDDDEVSFQFVGHLTRGAILGKVNAGIDADDTEVIIDVHVTPGSTAPTLNSFTARQVANGSARFYLSRGASESGPNYEVLAYEEAELLGTWSERSSGTQWKLKKLHRGMAGTTPAVHGARSSFFLIDKHEVVRVPIKPTWFRRDDTTILQFKLLSYNAFGGGKQQVDDEGVGQFGYRVRGTFLATPVPGVTTVWWHLRNPGGGSGEMYVSWVAISDPRGDISYEVRKGSADWASAVPLGVTRETEFQIASDGTYWVAARLTVTGFGENPDAPVYKYGEAGTVVVKGLDDFLENVVIRHDELPLQFSNYSAMVLADNPALYWRMGETEAASGPNVRDDVDATFVGTYSGSQVAYRAAPLIGSGKSVDLDTDGLITLSADARHNLSTTTAWAFALWFKTTTGTKAYLYSRDTGSWLTVEADGSLKWESSSGGSVVSASVVVNDGNPHFVVVYWSPDGLFGDGNDQLCIFLDGELIAQQDDVTIDVTSGAAYLGDKNGGAPTGHLDGTLDEYFVVQGGVAWHYQATSLYALRGHANWANVVMGLSPTSFCRFHETAPKAILDASGNNRDGEVDDDMVPLVDGLISGDPDKARDFSAGPSVYAWIYGEAALDTGTGPLHIQHRRVTEWGLGGIGARFSEGKARSTPRGA